MLPNPYGPINNFKTRLDKYWQNQIYYLWFHSTDGRNWKSLWIVELTLINIELIRRLRFSSDADIVRLTNARIIIIIINNILLVYIWILFIL